MSVLTINGTPIKDPQKLTWDLYDLDSEDGAGRNQQGEMFRDRVASKRKLNCEWGPLELEEMAALLQAMDDVFFTLKYPDAHDGAYKEGTFYVGDRSAPMYYWNEEKQKSLWIGLTANFVER